MSGSGDGKVRRSYKPSVESLEALRPLSSATASLPSVDLAIALDVVSHLGTSLPQVPGTTTPGSTWDEALTQTRLGDILAARTTPITSTVTTSANAADVQAGLSQLNRYLARTWYRAGIPPQLHEDSTQAVYVTLLQNLGRDRFDQLLGEIGTRGIKDVLSRETAEGPDFFRAIDTVKKRVQREKTYQPLDSVEVASAASTTSSSNDWKGALQEVMKQSLTPREAALINDTLMGKTPAEIAASWGVAPKTVSNEKTRVIQKLREVLVADLTD